MSESQLVIGLDRKPNRNRSTRILFRTLPVDVADKARKLDADDTVIIKDSDGVESAFTVISKTKLSITVKSQRDLEEESVQDRDSPASDLVKNAPQDGIRNSSGDDPNTDDVQALGDVSGKIPVGSVPAGGFYDREEHHGMKAGMEDLHDLMYDHLPGFMQSAYGFIHRNASEIHGRVKRAFQRVHRGYDDYDVWDLGNNEIARLSKLLLAMARTGNGYPLIYIQDDSDADIDGSDADIHNGRKYWLNKHDDDYDEWLKTPWDRFGITPIDSAEDFNYKFNETVEEYGADGAAWTQDLYYASRVFSRYSQLKDSSLEDYEDRAIGLIDDGDNEKRIESEFRRVWSWLGEVLPDMWD